MKTVELASWDEFRPTIQDIRDEYAHHQVADDLSDENPILFRGHADASWRLTTTLERCTDRSFSVERYMMYTSMCANELESFTGREWNIPRYPDLQEEIKAKQHDFRPHLPCHEYLVYLRHHGFPSPLLDWTESPYIAAYFAFAERKPVERVAIYAYIETPEGVKVGWGGAPRITMMGPYVSTHSRHFAQKSVYTVATHYDEDTHQHTFCNHELVFDEGYPHQDVLIKITVPCGDRVTALRELGDYNINHFTLFQTEDALVKALALKTLELGTT